MSAEAEAYVASLDPLGWKLGLERIHRLCSLLGLPQHRFDSVHVVGTNGKSSVARMTAAIVAVATGAPTGAYVSPHIGSWRERILIGGEPIGEDAFAAAVERCREAALAADRAAGEDGPVSQFEFVTAAAFVAFAAAGVRFAAIEAGLGGRLDATNVIPSRATALTSVGLDHTEWLGETIAEIAAEKLAVLRPGTPLIAGELPPEAMALAEAAAAKSGGGLVVAGEPPPELTELVPPGYPRRNLGVALALARAVSDLPAESELAPALRDRLGVPGRAELIAGDPPVLLDAAHNPDGAAALAAAIEPLTGAAKAVIVIAVLTDKDAAGIAAALAPVCAEAIATQIPPEAIAGSGRPGSASEPASVLAARFAELGAPASAAEEVDAALRAGAERAREQRAPLVVCGSHYLLAAASGLRET